MHCTPNTELRQTDQTTTETPIISEENLFLFINHSTAQKMNVINSSRPMIRSLLLTRSVTPLLVRSYATAGTTEKSAGEKVSHLATGVADHAVMAVKFATDTVGGALGCTPLFLRFILRQQADCFFSFFFELLDLSDS
jgi:hypothetical protein